MENLLVQHLSREASVKSAGLAGIKILKMYHMENTNQRKK